MIQITGRRLSVAGALLLSATLSACIVVPVGRHRAVAYDTVTLEPPGPQVEVVGVAPGPGYFWIGGNWRWGGGRYAWAPGHWEPGRPGYRWEPHRWYRDGRGWRETPGHWMR